tara:strand:- start:26 stop:214 length:189 start_codon:yes stop_codon:yes gene_type:complete
MDIISKIKSVKYNKPTMGDTSTVVTLIYDSNEKWSVPMVEDNSHYQEVLKWVEEGNTIEAAD